MTDATASAGGIPSPEASSAPEVNAPSASDVSSLAEAADPTLLFKKHKHKVKVDGQDSEIEYDELVRDYQTRKAADKRFREAADAQKRAKDLQERLVKDPWSALKEAGKDPYSLAEQLLIQKLEFEGLSPAEKRAMQAEWKAQELEERLKREEESKTSSRKAQAEAKALQEIDQEIGDALKAMNRKPTPLFIKRVAEHLLAQHEAEEAALAEEYGDRIPDEAWGRVKRLSASEAVSRTRKDIRLDITEELSNMSIEELKEVLPKPVLDALRKADVAQVLAQDPMGSRKPRAEVQKPKVADKRMSTETFFKQLETRMGR